MNIPEHEGPTVTAAQLVRNFARFREMARVAPIRITHHGRETHVLSDLAEYRELCREAAAARDGEHKSDENGAVFSLADWIDDAIIICDQALRVVFANRTATAMIATSTGALTGRSLREQLPDFAESLAEVHAMRALRLKEPSAADIPSPFQRGAWLRYQTFPLGDRVVLKFRDITEDVQRHRLADVKGAILQAMEEHGAVGYVRTSVRGTIEHANTPFCRMMHLSPERLDGMPVADLAVATDRLVLREHMEAGLRGGGGRALDVRFLSGRGRAVPTHVAIVQLQGAYGSEGALMLVTERVDPADANQSDAEDHGLEDQAVEDQRQATPELGAA